MGAGLLARWHTPGRGVVHSPKVDVLEVKGNTLEHAYSPDTTGVVAAQWDRSQNSRVVLGRPLSLRGGRLPDEGVHQIRKWADGGRGRYSDLPMGVDLPFFHLLSLRAGGIAYASRDGSFGVLNDRDEVTPLGPKAIPIYAANYEDFLLSREGSAIQFAYERSGKSPALFSVNERRLTEASSSLGQA